MTYEIEKRSLLDDMQYIRVKKYLDEHAQHVSTKKLHTMLFNHPAYLRVRFAESDSQAIITSKTGTYHDVARQEIELPIKLSDAPAFLKILETAGFKTCTYLRTLNDRYVLRDLKVDVSQHEFLGTIVEVEATTDRQEEISRNAERVQDLMKELHVIELPADTYQNMMDDISQSVKTYNECVFRIGNSKKEMMRDKF